MRDHRNYCVHCNWEASTDDHSRNELSKLAIEHAVSTGHDINSNDVRKESTETSLTTENPSVTESPSSERTESHQPD